MLPPPYAVAASDEGALTQSSNALSPPASMNFSHSGVPNAGMSDDTTMAVVAGGRAYGVGRVCGVAGCES